MAIPKGGSFNHGHHGGGGGGGHDTHGDRHKGTTPGGTGGGVTGGTAGHQSHHPSGGYVGHPLAWVVRRQQVLRRAGFNIAVDGIYGPATSSAWAAFLSGINHSTSGILHGRGHDGSGVPPGYVYYKGHLVSHEQSKLLHRVTRLVGQATTTAALAKSADVGRHAALARHVANQIAIERRQQRDLSQRHLLLHDVAGRIGEDAKGRRLLPGEDPNVAFQRRVARERRVTHQELLREGASLESARVRGRLDGLFGGDFKNRYLHPDYLLHRAAHGHVDASDLTFLMHEGLLGGDESDVRTIQQVINHDGGHVTVNGQFDQQTFDGLDQLYAREARREFASQIDAITTEFYHDDIARAATTAALGVNHKLLTPAQLLHLLQTGGPGADRMGSALAHYVQFNTRQQALWKLQAQRANQILKTTGPISRSLARDTLRASGQAQDQALGEADTLSQFSMILAIKQDNAERLLAQWAASHQPGFFSELADGAAGLVGSGIALGYHYSGAQYAWNAVAEGGGKVNDAWNWTQTTHNAQRAALGLGDLIASYTGGWDPTLQHPDGLSVMEAWQQSDAHLSELQSQGGVNALIFESLVDPLNFVGAGAVAAVFDGIKFGLRIGEIGAAVGVLRGTDVVDRLAPEISVALHDRLIRPVYRAHAFADTVHEEGTFAAIGDTALAARARETRVYKMANVTRSVAQRAVEDKMAVVYGALRPIASRQVAEMRGVEGEVGRLADEFDKAAQLLPADFTAQGEIDSAAQVAALQSAVPHLSSAILELGATLHLSPGGRLSFTGRRIRAWFMENARRQASARFLILDDLAKQEIDDSIRVGLRHLSLEELIAHHQHYYPEGRLDELLRNAGSWFGGGLPDEFYGPLTRELQLFRERLTKQILPAFDEMLLAHGAEYPRVLDRAHQEIREAINRLMGFDVDHLYNEANWVDAPNPNFGHTYRPDSARFRQRTELARYEDSRTDYADYLVAIGQRTVEEASAWVAEKVAAKRTELAAAWKKEKHGWIDTRETVRVPEPSVGGLLTRSYPGHADARDLIDVTTSYNRMPRKAFKSVKQLPGPEDIQSIVGRMGDGSVSAPKWLAHVRASQKLEVIHAIAERHSLSQLYFDESLLWDGLREHQSRSMRGLYYAMVGSLGVWKTAVLPLRPAFVVRNVLDNQAKMMLEGYRDPSLFFRQAGDSVKSVLGELFVRPMRAILTQVDALLGTDLLLKYDWLIGRFWFQSSSALEKLMLAHGIPHPPELFRATLGDVEVGVRDPDLEPLNRGVGAIDSDVRAISRIDPEADHPLARFKKYVWDIAASGPEGYQSRVLYVSKYRQELVRGATEMEAMDTALKTVHKALFDYSTVTVLEDTLKVVAPFLFFWRKNAGFWANQVVEKPWFFYQGNKMYEAHRDSNSDQPEWMRRYVSLSPIASLTDEIPGMQWASDYFRTANFDPLTFSSMVSFYRAFIAGNPELPADKQGVGFISSLVNGFDSVGLGINPFLRSAGARLGLLDMRAWQDVFPQTTIFQSLTSEEFLQEHLGVGPNGFNPEDWFSDTVFQALGSDISEQGLNYDRFQYYVGQELAAQIARGEKPDRAAATKTIQRYLLFQNLTGYALGVFPRRVSADDQQIYLISDKVRQIYADEGLTPDQQREQVQSLLSSAGSDLSLAYSAYTENRKLFAKHGYSAAAFDRWLIGAKAAQAFFLIDDFDEQQKFLSEHPEALPIINPVVDGREIPSGYIKNQVLLADTASAIELGSHFLDGIDAAFDVKKAIGGALVYPELQAYWAKNDTPEQTRQRQVAGAYFGYLAKVNDTYFAIPEGDFDARTNYLAAHPELQQYWAKNDTASDDYRAIQLSANSTFRTIYFRLVDAGDWDAADAFLKRHSFIFDYTSAEGRVTPDGHWLPRSKAASDYAAVSSLLKVYYSFRDPKLAHEYLVAHPQVQRWLKMYEGNGGLQQEAADYDKIRALLDGYFALDSAGKAAYLAAHPELKAYFAKYGHNRSESQHARDYLAVKPQLDAFFDLPESERSAYLAKHPDLQAYFAKYGHHSTHGRLRSAIAADPEIKQRYDFWTHFFALPPNERPRYVHLHAEEMGVFVYGSLAGNWRHDIEQKWHRDAIRFGHTEKAQAYVTIKPLMDIYFKLKPGSADRALFLQTNPELQVYFETFSPTLTGSKKLDKLVKEYLRLPQFSAQRSQFIVDHPEVSAYFNRDANPKELAMQRLVDGYFSLPFGKERDQYLFEHPEVKIYFDQRHHQNDLFSSIAAAFNETDPRMAAFYEQYADIIPLDAIKQFQLHAQRVHEIIDKGARRERAPETAAKSQTRRDRSVPA